MKDALMDDRKSQKVSVVIPVFNEKENVKPLLSRLARTLDGITSDYEIIFIDDGSTDNTTDIIYEEMKTFPEVTLIKFSRNFGQHAAAQAGFDHCSGDIAVWIDADLQESPEDIPRLINKLNEGYDFVYGIKTEYDASFLKKLSSFAFVWLFNKVAHISLPANATTLRVMSKKFMESVNRMPERVRFLAGLNAWVGFRRVGVPVEYGRRNAGESKYNFSKMLALAVDGLFSFSIVPIRAITFTGFVMFAASLAAATAIIIGELTGVFGGSGWASIMVSLFFIGGIQCVFMGMIGEYAGRIYLETKARPLYIIESVVKGGNTAGGNGPDHDSVNGG